MLKNLDFFSKEDLPQNWKHKKKMSYFQNFFKKYLILGKSPKCLSCFFFFLDEWSFLFLILASTCPLDKFYSNIKTSTDSNSKQHWHTFCKQVRERKRERGKKVLVLSFHFLLQEGLVSVYSDRYLQYSTTVVDTTLIFFFFYKRDTTLIQFV